MSSSGNSAKEISSRSNEALKDAEKRVKDVDISNPETRRVRKGNEAHDETARNHFPKKVKLDIGGHFFTTSLVTLNKDPGSMLHAMFSGRFDTKPSEDGTYFIDRDGTHFRHILNYLRTGQLLVPKDEMIRVELLAEAEFYQIEGIVKALRASFFKDSAILSLEQRQTLVNWLKETGPITNASGKLLYCASRDGWGASIFHSCCDNKGPTVTVVKSGNYIFGGYTDKNWDGSGVYKRASDSFLFSLVNPNGLPPTKMPLIAGREGYAIYCDGSYGPVFGGQTKMPVREGQEYALYYSESRDVHDLQIRSDVPSYGYCTVNLNNTYQCPTGQNANTFLTGNQFSPLSEMEVFGFDKLEAYTL